MQSAEPRTAIDQVAFGVWVDGVMVRVLPRVGLAIALAALVWWPLDRLVFRGTGGDLAAMDAFRFLVIGTLVPASLLLPRWTWARSNPTLIVGPLAALIVAGCGWLLAEAGNSEPLWFSFTYIAPLFGLHFVVPLRTRIGVEIALSAACGGAFLFHPSEAWIHPGAGACLSNLVFVTALATALGHVVYLALRSGFLLGRRLEEKQSALLVLTNNLEDRVLAQTRQLRALHGRAQETGAEQRQRIARDLHDGLGQQLASLRLLAGLGVDAGEEEARRLLAELDEQVGDIQRSLRRLLDALQPRLVEERGLVGAVRELLLDTERRWGLAFSLDAPGALDDLPDSHRTALYRVCQEALHNTVRHAAAGLVRVRLQLEVDRVVLEMSDDGRGMAPDRSGRGLEGIQQRAAELGGRASWQPAEPGTRLTFEVPR